MAFPTMDLPAIWVPVKEKSEGNPLALQIHEQAKGSLRVSADILSVVLRLLSGETEVERVFAPPQGDNAEQQGDWDDSVITFAFRRYVKILSEERGPDQLTMLYEIEGKGAYHVILTKDGIEKFKD